jgi:5-methylcytosine-specific restriction protein A
MATYILTWNPRRWTWTEDKYNSMVERTRKGEPVKERSSCGNTKRIARGDRLFLLRQTVDRGLVGAGRCIKRPHLDSHWDKARKNEEALYVGLEFDTLLPIASRLSIEDLIAANGDFHWNNLLASGIQIPDQFAGALESLWLGHLAQIGWQGRTQFLSPDEVTATIYVEGATQRVTANSYERNPEARHACITHYGPRCVICGFDFAEVYGDAGNGYIHVHHVRDLATIGQDYEVDPVRDMRPVCPNCHAMLHTTKPAMEIERLWKIVMERCGR